MIMKYNPYYTAFMSAKEQLAQHNHVHLCLKTICEPTADQQRYNRPTASEIAVLMPGAGEEQKDTGDIVVQDWSGPLRRVSELHSSYCPLRYPLIHAYGKQGWNLTMQHTDIREYALFALITDN
jgi:hypothetical protein